MKISPRLIPVGFLLALAFPPIAAAHHSFAMFDQTKKLTITGTVLEFQWTNPHSWLYVMGSVNGEPPEKWSLEGLSPSMLTRHGWKSDDIKAGDKVTVVMEPLRDGSHGGALNLVTREDGKVLVSYGAAPQEQDPRPDNK